MSDDDKKSQATIRTEADVARWCRERLAWVEERLEEARPGGRVIYAPEDIASLKEEAEALAMMIQILEADGF